MTDGQPSPRIGRQSS